MYSYNRLLITLVILLTFNSIHSQTGPGGVGNSTNNTLWLKGDNGIYTDTGSTQATNGQRVRQWDDASGNNRHAIQNTFARRPFFEASSENNMPGLSFTGNTFIDGPALGIGANSSYTYLITFRDTQSSTGAITNDRGNFILDRTTGTNNLASLKQVTGNTYGYQKRNNAGGGLGGLSTTTAINTNSKIIEMRRDYNVDYQLFYNADQESTLVDNNGATTPPNPRIGRHATQPNRGLTGFINEFIIYNFALNSAQTIIVNNYLSAKYNVPLNTNDLYTQDNSGNGNFDHHVAGIGQASDGSNHTDSQGTGIIRINNPSALNNNEFLFWGEEANNTVYSFDTNAANHTEQLNSKWRVTRINNPGRVDISFDISNMDLSGKSSCSPLQLVIDNDDDFLLADSNDEVYDLIISGSTATATNVRIRNNRYLTLRYTNQIVWDGTSFFNGSGAANAPNNTDSCLKLTVKSGTAALLSVDAHVRDIEVESGATLNVADGVLLEVENDIVINGTIELLGEAQLIQNHLNNTNNSGTGVLIKRQQGVSNLYNYNYWSAPVNNGGTWQIGDLEDSNGVITFSNALNANASSMPITLSSEWLYSFNGDASTYSEWAKLTTTSSIAPGIGYTMKGSGTTNPEQEYIFKGLPNDGNYSIAIAPGDEILLGNPYPSALDADQFITDNTASIDGTLYFWEHFATNNSHFLNEIQGGYATRNLMMGTAATADASGLTSGIGSASKPAPEQFIPVGQGFFVTASASGGNIVFNNGQRDFARESVIESIFYKNNTTKTNTDANTDQRTKIWFSFTEPGQKVKQLGLGYDVKASEDYDNGYDAKTYDDLRNDVNWALDDNLLTIQALSAININDVLPLKIKITDAGIYKFAIDNMQYVPDHLDIYLKDNDLNIYYDIKNQTTDIFLDSFSDENRFSIVFQNDNILSTNDLESRIIYTSYNPNTKILELHNTENRTIDNIKVVNTLGQEVLNIKAPTSKAFNVEFLNSGLYIIETTLNNNSVPITIKFIKY